MFSAQAIARSEESRAKQIAVSIGRIGLGLLTKGVSEAGVAAGKAGKLIVGASKFKGNIY